jgi:redox-sensitive bicupin YhaK (pirin superfamily)
MAGKYLLERADQRFKTKIDWLESYHSFSFAEHYDPKRLGFGALRVLNDDTIAPKSGFGAHSHRDMEIITIPFSGKLTHKDNIGNTSSIDSSMVQIMSAGTGITHAEWNDHEEPVELFQIWITPREWGLPPRYEEKHIDEKLFENNLFTFVSREKSDSGIQIFQDAYLSRGKFSQKQNITYKIQGKNTGVYIIVIEGAAKIDETYTLSKRDAAGVSDTSEVKLEVEEGSDILVLEVPLVG